jgi:hypothetical protein
VANCESFCFLNNIKNYSKEYRTYLEKFCKWRSLMYDFQYGFGFIAKKKKQKSRL